VALGGFDLFPANLNGGRRCGGGPEATPAKRSEHCAARAVANGYAMAGTTWDRAGGRTVMDGMGWMTGGMA
jgi:hypothetical protein